MERAVLLGLGVGMVMILFNYLFFVRIFPPNKFLIMPMILQRVLGIGYFLLMLIFFFKVGEFLTFLPAVQHEDSNPVTFTMIAISIYFGSLFWFLLQILVARGVIKSGRNEERLSLLFLILCIFGLCFGATVGFFILCVIYSVPFNGSTPVDQLSIPHFAFLFLVPLMFMGIPFFSVPVFLLVLKPLYTREGIIRFTSAGRNTNLPSGPLALMNFMYKISFFWIDLFYPDNK